MTGEHRTSRRALLAAGIGGLGGLAASALSNATPAAAANGQTVTVGGDLTGTATTKLTCTSESFSAVWALASAATGIGVGLRGETNAPLGTGVWGIGAQSSTGVSGESEDGIGVSGKSNIGTGVYGAAGGLGTGVQGIGNGGPGVGGSSTDDIGVVGVSTHATGVVGRSWAAAKPGISAVNTAGGTGLYGFSGELFGDTPPNTGVLGRAEGTTARAVHGKTTSGQGVRGEATTGVGVQAVAATGVALAVSGRATFNRSGRASVPANASYVDVSVPGGLASAANVLATLQTYRTGVFVAAARINYPTAGKVRIYLNKVASSTSSTNVAWLVIG